MSGDEKMVVCENCHYWTATKKGLGYDGHCHRPFLAGRKEPTRYNASCYNFIVQEEQGR